MSYTLDTIYGTIIPHVQGTKGAELVMVKSTTNKAV